MDACSQCPHANDCLKVGSCLDDLNAPWIAANNFPQRMTPIQASQFMAALRAGRTLRRICGGGKFGPAIASLTKFHKHCRLYRDWGAEALQLAEANRKASEKLKGSGASRANETHCRNGHPYSIYGGFRDSHNDGRMFRYCIECRLIKARNPVKPLSPETIEQMKTLLRAGKAVRTFTSGAGYLGKFELVKRLRQSDPEFNNLVLLGSERRKLLRQPSGVIAIPKPQIIRTTNLRAPTLTSSLAGRADVVFSAVNEAVSLRLPRHIRDDVMGQLFLDVEEGRVALSDVKRFARKYTSDIYEEEKWRISLDAPAFRDGTGGSKLDRLSEADGMWA
jgi:hypothetical protein